MSPAPVLAPLDYSLLFPDLVNFNVEKNPCFPLYVYASEGIPNSTTVITFLEFGRAANRVAHVLRPGRQGPEGQTVVLIAATDTLLYHAIIAGMSIAGLTPFPVSPRNSSAAIAYMMKKTNCSRILTLHRTHQSLIDGIHQEMEGIELHVDEIPTLAYAFPKLGCEVESDPFDPYPTSSSRLNPNDIAIYAHSSGSTGFPKPIAISHKFQVDWIRQAMIHDYYKGPVLRRIGAMALPPFHVYGMTHQLYVPMGRVGPVVLYPPRSMTDPFAGPVIPTGDNILDCVKRTRCGLLMTVPAFLAQWSTSPEAIEELKKLDLLISGGGVLPTKIGDALCAAGIPVGVGYGGTEFGNVTSLPDRQDIDDGDWEWMRIQEGITVRWVPQGGDTYECQVLMSENYHIAVLNLPDVPGYATSDLFVKHPTKDMWKIIGRKDDVIVLASGEKTVPAPMESVMESGTLVQGAVLFGRGRDQVGMLVEPRAGHEVDINDPPALEEFRNKIWPLVEEANATSPAFSRVFKDMILVTSRDKPMARSGKGSVQKKATLKRYESEINALYDSVKGVPQSNGSCGGPSAWTAEALEEWLVKQADAISSGRHIDPNVDMFAQGFDSLSATHVRNQILGALRNSSEHDAQNTVSLVPQNVVFEYPTIKLLSSRIACLVSPDGTAKVHGIDVGEAHKIAMDAMIDKYSVGLNEPVDGVLGADMDVDVDGSGGGVVLLTGSTGGLGSYLIAQLLQNPAVDRVYALNRPSASSSSEERQQSAFVDKGLPVELLQSDKLVYVEADTAQENCGLSGPRYDEIRNSVTIVIHNAWRLDFNLSLSSFESNVRATRNLIDLALGSPRRNRVRFLFTSSIGSASSWDLSRGPFPEEIQLDSSVAVGSGYGESKYVAERIVVRSGLRATSIRIGQIAGGTNGSWATTDWVPIMVKSSVALGVLPDAHGVVSWLRPQEAIIELALTKDALPPALNLVNPRGTPWVDVMSCVRDSAIQYTGLANGGLAMIPFSEWFGRLEDKAEGISSNDLQNIPAIKLLEFFRAMSRGDQGSRRSGSATTEAGGVVNMSTAKAQLASKTVADMQPIGHADVRQWIQYWCSKGFL